MLTTSRALSMWHAVMAAMAETLRPVVGVEVCTTSVSRSSLLRCARRHEQQEPQACRHGWHQCARCAAAWRGAKAVLGRASGLGELTLITQRAGVALVQDVVCRQARRRHTSKIVQDVCKIGAR